jgi:hypothetical protein
MFTVGSNVSTVLPTAAECTNCVPTAFDEWIKLAEKGKKCVVFVNAVMKFRVLYSVNVLTS